MPGQLGGMYDLADVVGGGTVEHRRAVEDQLRVALLQGGRELRGDVMNQAQVGGRTCRSTRRARQMTAQPQHSHDRV